MNYFEFYDLPVKFNMDIGQLKRLFLQKSKATHPDYFTLASEEEQDQAMKEAVLNNQAYKVLADKNLRTEYVLSILGIWGEGEKQHLSPDFLMEMMDLNESVMDARGDEELTQKVTQVLTNMLQELNKAEAPILEEYDQTGNSALLENVKDFYFKRKYLERLV